jgi:hypothetical protein
MMAFVVASYVDAGWLARCTMKHYGIGPGKLLPWASIGKTALAASAAGVLVVSSVWTDVFGFAGIAVAGAAYLTAFTLLLLAMRVPEALWLQMWGKRLAFRRASAARP